MLAASLHSEQVKSIYDAHHGWLECWLRKRLGNASDAADLAQDTFVRVLTKEMAIREPRAMLTTIAQGMVANFYRRRDIELAYEQALAAWPDPASRDELAQAFGRLTESDLAARVAIATLSTGPPAWPRWIGPLA